MNQIQKQLLTIVQYQLFGGTVPKVKSENIREILKEAKFQTVFTIVFSFLQNTLKRELPELLLNQQMIFLSGVMTNKPITILSPR